MDQGTEADQGFDEGSFRSGRADHPDACENGAGDSGKNQEDRKLELAGIIRLTVAHYFPEINDWIKAIPDPRRQHPSLDYPLPHLMWQTMLMFVVQPGSRQQFDLDKATPEFDAQLRELSGFYLEGRRATAETADDLLQKLQPEQLRQLRDKMLIRLVRNKVLDLCRHSGMWLVAADGTGLYTFSKRHCPHCTSKTSNGVTTYAHNVLEMKLISPCGLAISLESEFITNRDGETKQDCELKAFVRAAARLKQTWPKMRFMFLLDGLYPNTTIMRICKENGWDYMVTLKDGNLPLMSKVALPRLESQPDGKTSHWVDASTSQEIRWAENLRHDGHITHVISCDETTRAADGKKTTTHFRWITSVRPSACNPVHLCNKVGRQRWKIENQGFNAQKNGGYKLEHGYGVIGHAWQNYYLLIQIVDMIMQLATRTDAIHKLPGLERERTSEGRPKSLLEIYKSMKNFIKRLGESFRLQAPSWLDPAQLGRIQLRILAPG
jgi:hypothetical protein